MSPSPSVRASGSGPCLPAQGLLASKKNAAQRGQDNKQPKDLLVDYSRQLGEPVEDRIRVPTFSVVYFSRGTLPQERGEKGTTGRPSKTNTGYESRTVIQRSDNSVMHIDPLIVSVRETQKLLHAARAWGIAECS